MSESFVSLSATTNLKKVWESDSNFVNKSTLAAAASSLSPALVNSTSTRGSGDDFSHLEPQKLDKTNQPTSSSFESLSLKMEQSKPTLSVNSSPVIVKNPISKESDHTNKSDSDKVHFRATHMHSHSDSESESHFDLSAAAPSQGSVELQPEGRRKYKLFHVIDFFSPGSESLSDLSTNNNH